MGLYGLPDSAANEIRSHLMSRAGFSLFKHDEAHGLCSEALKKFNAGDPFPAVQVLQADLAWIKEKCPAHYNRFAGYVEALRAHKQN